VPLRCALLPLDLEQWGEARVDTVVLTAFSDERPLQGLTGLVDWRLCARLSRWIRAERISGARGDSLLFPGGHRLHGARVLWWGLGPRAAYDESRLRGDLRAMMAVLEAAHIAAFALHPPGRASGDIAPATAAHAVVELAATARQVWIVDEVSAHKELASLVRR
jgi:hypothetical protein